MKTYDESRKNEGEVAKRNTKSHATNSHLRNAVEAN